MNIFSLQNEWTIIDVKEESDLKRKYLRVFYKQKHWKVIIRYKSFMKIIINVLISREIETINITEKQTNK